MLKKAESISSLEQKYGGKASIHLAFPYRSKISILEIADILARVTAAREKVPKYTKI